MCHVIDVPLCTLQMKYLFLFIRLNAIRIAYEWSAHVAAPYTYGNVVSGGKENDASRSNDF